MIHEGRQTIPWARPAIDEAELNEVVACMKSGWLTCGPRVAKFEELMAERAGRVFGIAVNNGTAALDLAMKAINLGPREEVIVPTFSYIATASAVMMQGATPVFCDIDPRNLCMDPASAADSVSPQTRAILCTDYGGNPCDFAALADLADRHGLPLVLDGAQSIGTMFRGKPALSYGLISTVSFHAAKTMTTVEGGMAFTDDETLAKRMRIIRSQGEDPRRKYRHIELGHNFRMTELHAAIGLAQLSKLDAFLEDRQKLAARYRTEFTGMRLRMPSQLPDGQNSHFLFTILVGNRDGVADRLKSRGIETRVCYPIPLYDQPILRRYKTGRCPVAEETCAAVLNLPMFFGMTADQQRHITDELRETLRESSRSAA
jgi:dTDP-4-amino-4,6-dideoxygalactose transaminase